MTIITRFAPSPTGYLHEGHALSALIGHELARRAGGQFLLRIEDIDPTRARPAFMAAIEEDLRWLGLAWPAPVWRQSQRMDVYAEALGVLAAKGLLYPCFCTRADIAASANAPHGPDGPLYPGTCRHMSQDERAARMAAPHALRLDMAAAMAEAGALVWLDVLAGEHQARPELFGDVVLARKEVATSYHLAVVVDDAAQAVSDVVRGADLFAATHVHRLLQALLGLPTPRYRHHKLLLDAEGRRLAKRDGAPSLAQMRGAGADGQALAQRLLAAVDPAIWSEIKG